MRYHVMLGGVIKARAASFDDALAFLHMALQDDPKVALDIVDTEVGLPFDRTALVEKARRAHADGRS